MTLLPFIEILRSFWEEPGRIGHQQRWGVGLLLLLPLIHLRSTLLAKLGLTRVSAFHVARQLLQIVPRTIRTSCATQATFHLMGILQPVVMPMSRSKKTKFAEIHTLSLCVSKGLLSYTFTRSSVMSLCLPKLHYFWPCLFSTKTPSHFCADFLAKLACLLERRISWVFAVQSRVRLCENGWDVLGSGI